MSIHDGTAPDETLPDTPAASTPTDHDFFAGQTVESLLAMYEEEEKL